LTSEFPFILKNLQNSKFAVYSYNSWEIILYLLKSHHFRIRTYLLYIIIKNNISRPVHDLPPATSTTPCPKSGGRDLSTPGLTPMSLLDLLKTLSSTTTAIHVGYLHQRRRNFHYWNFAQFCSSLHRIHVYLYHSESRTIDTFHDVNVKLSFIIVIIEFVIAVFTIFRCRILFPSRDFDLRNRVRSLRRDYYAFHQIPDSL